jgi:uncharacterized BrkB/YihY/UPF0761 family membrane protein
MTEVLLVFVMTLTGLTDGLRDKMNNARHKRPHSHLPWPLIDRWHLIKRYSLYSPWAYFLALFFWPDMNPQNWYSWLIGALGAAIAWKVTPEPKHWK